ncbi:MAG: hypothetical protein WCO55_00585 [Candidatus Falkowbacteria bacterium]
MNKILLLVVSSLLLTGCSIYTSTNTENKPKEVSTTKETLIQNKPQEVQVKIATSTQNQSTVDQKNENINIDKKVEFDLSSKCNSDAETFFNPLG